jgi:hypothetical protein
MLICANRCLALHFDLSGASFPQSPLITRALRKQELPAARRFHSSCALQFLGNKNFSQESEATCKCRLPRVY